MYAFVNVCSTLSWMTSIVGFVFAFFNPVVTIVCGAFSLFSSIMNVCFGDQNNWNTELFTIVIGIMIGCFSDISIWLSVAAALCLVSGIFGVVGVAVNIYVFIRSKRY